MRVRGPAHTLVPIPRPQVGKQKALACPKQSTSPHTAPHHHPAPTTPAPTSRPPPPAPLRLPLALHPPELSRRGCASPGHPPAACAPRPRRRRGQSRRGRGRAAAAPAPGCPSPCGGDRAQAQVQAQAVGTPAIEIGGRGRHAKCAMLRAAAATSKGGATDLALTHSRT